MVQIGHDGLEVLIHLFESPVEAHGVLAHLQGGGGHTAGVGRLGGGEEQSGTLQGRHCLRRAGHVGALGHGEAAVLDQCLGGVLVQLVLGGAGQRNVAGDLPDAGAALVVFGGGVGLHVLPDPLALHFLTPTGSYAANGRLQRDLLTS